MAQIIIAIACMIGLIALGLVFVRFYREGEESGRKAPSPPPRPRSQQPADPVPSRHMAFSFTDRQIVQQGRKLAEEVEQFLADK